MDGETIIAISTPPGFGGLGIVRLTGRQSLSIAKKIFKPRGKSVKISPRLSVLGFLYDYEHREFFDEAYLTFFPKPHSYTTEDVVEISCHGSPAVLEEVVRLGEKAGARHAHPGEFTLRAYLGGRIDILQAEAVNDLINASSFKQAKISFAQVEGGLSKKVNSLRRQLVRLLVQVEAGIEFPDDGLPIMPEGTAKSVTHLLTSVQKLVSSYDMGKVLRQGFNLAIIGRTNVGKSTLFNSLLARDRAIVSPHPGTTRDYLTEKMKIKDIVFNLMDMAGLDLKAHPVEKEGIIKGERLARQADGVLLLFDSSRKENSDDLRLIKKYQGKKALIVFNKMDLPQKMDTERIKSESKDSHYLDISALRGTNLERLKDLIHEGFIPVSKDGDEFILHVRQKLLLENVQGLLEKSLILLREGYPEEVYAEELRSVIPLFGQLTGEIRVDEVIDGIFSRFCVGK